MRRPPTSIPYTRASDVGQWTYCQRAWWLAQQGHAPENPAALTAGLVAHDQHGRKVAQAHHKRILALLLLALGLLALLAAGWAAWL